MNEHGKMLLDITAPVREIRPPRVKNALNAYKFPKWAEYNGRPSETIPNEAMSMREILHRYTHNLPLNVPSYQTFFDEDNNVPDYQHLDFAERQALRDAYVDEIQELRQKAAQKQAKYKEWLKDKADKDKAAYEAKIAETIKKVRENDKPAGTDGSTNTP